MPHKLITIIQHELAKRSAAKEQQKQSAQEIRLRIKQYQEEEQFRAQLQNKHSSVWNLQQQRLRPPTSPILIPTNSITTDNSPINNPTNNNNNLITDNKLPTNTNKMSTLLLFIVDESLSMRTRKQQIVDGINQFLDVQRQIEGPDARLVLIKFNSVVTFLHRGTKLSEVEPLKLSEYNPGGRTACFDAIVQGVQAAEALRGDAERVVAIILTDGEDTASVENQVPKSVRKLVRAYEAKPDWSFTFIGRPPDAWCRQKPVSKVSYEHHVSSTALMSQRHKNVTSATRRLREFNSRRASVLISSQ